MGQRLALKHLLVDPKEKERQEAAKAAEEAAAAAALSVRRVGTMDDLRCLDEDLDPRSAEAR